jgi:hypothetical protein
MRVSMLLMISIVCVAYGMDDQNSAIMGGRGEGQYLLQGNTQDNIQEAYRHDQTGCCRGCCDRHGAKIGVCCCVLCAVGAGVGLGYLPSCDAVEQGFNSLRDILEWLRGPQ